MSRRLLLSLACVALMAGGLIAVAADPPTTGTVRINDVDYQYTLKRTNQPPATPAPSAPAMFTLKQFDRAAPSVVHVNAIDVPLSAGTCLDNEYVWDFGDGSTPLRGWLGAHVYDKPGQYTLKLKIADSTGLSVVQTIVVEVVADSRFAFYVSADGDDGNPGSVDKPVKTFARAASLLRDNTRIYFRRGDQFDVFDPMTVKVKNSFIGAFGDPAKPRPVLWKTYKDPKNTGAKTFFSLFKPVSNVIIQDICFDSPFPADNGIAPKIPADAIYAAGTGITVRGCEFRNINDCINTSRLVDGLLVENNSAPLDTGVRSYLVWGQGSNHVYLNNTFANSTREHGFRMVDVSHVLVSGNNMTNLDRTKIDKEDIAKGAIEMHRGDHAYISGNTVNIGALRVGPRGGETDPPESATDWCVIERNTLNDVGVQIRPGSHHVMVRDNVVHDSEGVKIYRPDEAGRTSSDIVIDHNTSISNEPLARFLMLEGKADRVTLTNNLLVAPKMAMGSVASAAVYVGGTDLSSFTQIANNVWPTPAMSTPASKGAIFYVAPKWGVDQGFVTFDQWKTFAQVKDDSIANVDLNADSVKPSTLSAGAR